MLEPANTKKSREILKPVAGRDREHEARQAEFVRFTTNLDKQKPVPSNPFGPFWGPAKWVKKSRPG